jgi:hypothetical protein
MKLSTPVVATVVIAVVIGAYALFAHVSAGRKLAAIGEPEAPLGAYRITLDFAPERFHQTRLQEAGRLVEVRDRTVYMMDMTPAALRAVAGEYWVAGVDRWDGQR